jgi:5-formyltetrahydrofolate cyclo-ligase
MLSTTRGYKCGVAFEEQMVKEIPAAAHDIRMDSVITPHQRFDFGRI